MTHVVQPAEVYEPVDDLWIVTSYFNPARYRSRLRNLQLFKERVVGSNLHLLVVECAFGEEAFSLPPSPQTIQVRCPHVLWQKERLLNLAMSELPAACTKVAWVDCDVLFENPRWAAETSRLLDDYGVVQPFDGAVRLARGRRESDAGAEVWRGFAASQSSDPQSLRSGDYRRHGETGLAWAARRSLLAGGGLYDACIIGGGDHVIAHALCGDWDSICIDRLVGLGTPQADHLRRWGESFSPRVRGALGVVPGVAFHLWHGEYADRRYTARHQELVAFGFDPQRDVRISAAGCWEWASDKPEMHRWAAAYFAARREDGVLSDTDLRSALERGVRDAS